MRRGLFQGDQAAFQQLLKDMNAGKVSTLIVSDCNPAYDAVNAEEFIAGLAKVKNQCEPQRWLRTKRRAVVA